MTRPWRTLLLSLFALLLLGQSVAAAAHCLRQARPADAGSAAAVARGWAALGLAMPLCTPDGLGASRSSADDDAGGETPARHAEPGFCLACQALPQASLPDPPRLPAPHWLRLTSAGPPPAPAPPRPAIRAPPCIPRGPPAA